MQLRVIKYLNQQNLSPTIKNCLRFLTQINNNQLQSDENDELYRKSILNTACVNVENNLRLYIHYMNSDSSSAKAAVPLKDLRSYLVSLVKCDTIQSINCHMMIRDSIECYLSEMFYKLKAVALADGRTYGDMRCLAERKYNLATVDDHLPTKTLDQVKFYCNVVNLKVDADFLIFFKQIQGSGFALRYAKFGRIHHRLFL